MPQFLPEVENVFELVEQTAQWMERVQKEGFSDMAERKDKGESNEKD